jgi:chromosome segregation ATPase
MTDQKDERIAELERFGMEDRRMGASMVKREAGDWVRYEDATTRIAALERERDNEKQSANAISAQADRLAKQRDELKKRVESLESELGVFTRHRKKLNEILESKEKQLDAVRNEIQSLRNKLHCVRRAR